MGLVEVDLFSLEVNKQGEAKILLLKKNYMSRS